MARPLVFALDAKMTQPRRRPGFRVELYDVRSTTDTIREIVRGLPLQTLAGPLDVSAFVASVEVEEAAGDFVTSGIPSSRVTLTIVDPTPGGSDGVFDPFGTYGSDAAQPARFLRRGNVLRLYEGDEDIPPTQWPLTFTGVLIGQAGIDRNRSTGRSELTMVAVGREAEFVNQLRTSDEFSAGAAYLTIATEIATNVMGLDIEETDLSGWGSQTAGVSQQFVEQSPLVSLAQLMLPDGFLPRFDGEGKLTQTQGETTKVPSRFYDTLDTIRTLIRPFSDLDAVNSVEVIGLDPIKTKVSQQLQPLAQVSITTGYFTPDEEVNVYWSNDRTLLAESVQLKIQRSVNGGLSSLGGGESFALILAENQPPAGLSIGARLSVGTGFSPYIIVFLTALYVALAAIPDSVTVALVAGVTIPVGRIIQAGALAAVLILMTKIGRGQYEFRGVPVEYVFLEIRAIAEIAGLSSEELNRVTVRNHLLQTQTDCDNTARVILFRQQARGLPRSMVALHDLRLEPDDVFELPDERRFIIETIRRRLVRGAAEVLADYSLFEVTAGVSP